MGHGLIYGNAERGPSGDLWSRLDHKRCAEDPNYGTFFFDDFDRLGLYTTNTTGNLGHYRAFTSNGGVIDVADATTVGGVVALSSDGDDEGAVIHQHMAPYKIPYAGITAMAWEARVKVSSIADTIADVFVGLCETIVPSATVPITATAGALADQNLIGFHRLGTDGDYFNTVYKANGVTLVTVKDNAVLLAANTFVKIGMFYDTVSKKIRFYADGVELADTKTNVSGAGTDTPNDVTLGLCAAIVNAAGSITPTVAIDWWQAALVF